MHHILRKVINMFVFVKLKGTLPHKGLNTERVVCHVTGNIYSLVRSSSQTPKTVVLDG